MKSTNSHSHDLGKITFQMSFTFPQSIQQADMLEYLKSLSPAERTELLGELYSQWEAWRNEQVLNQSIHKGENNY